jgi:hypothetical protein
MSPRIKGEIINSPATTASNSSTSPRNEMSAGTLALVLNGVFWIYFWTYFAFASQPTEKALYMDHPLDPYIFWGHAIGMGMNPLVLPFMKAMVCIELPSFFLATLLQNLLTGERAGRLLAGALGYFGDKLFPGGYPIQSSGVLFLGISISGYRLLATMLFSFLQWYFIGRVAQKLWHRWFSHPRALNS